MEELRERQHAVTYGDDEEQVWWDARAYFTWKMGERSLSEMVVGNASDAPSENYTLEDTIASDDLSPEETATLVARRALATQLLNHKSLTQREKDILRWRFVDDETLETIGERLNVTRERIRQIEGEALEKLRPIARRLTGA